MHYEQTRLIMTLLAIIIAVLYVLYEFSKTPAFTRFIDFIKRKFK